MSSRTILLAVLAVMLSTNGSAGVARAYLESPAIAIETRDRDLAERVAAVWTSVGDREHRVTRVPSGYRVALAPHVRFEATRLETPAVDEVVVVDDLHEALARVFSTEHQRVVELRPRPADDDATVTIAVDADAAALVVTGEGTLDVSVPRDALYVGYGIEREVPAGVVVRRLRAQSGDVPLVIRVPRDARVSLITRRTRIALLADYDGTSVWITVNGVPEVGAYQTELLLDGRAIGPLGADGRVDVSLARGSHVVEARLLAESGERLEWTRRTLRGPALYPLRLRAGGGRHCVTLDGDARAHVSRLMSRHDLHVVAEGQPDAEGYLEPGDRVCAWAHVLARGRDEILALTFRHDHERAVLAIEVEPLSPALLLGVPIVFFVGALALLLFAWWPRRAVPATHLAWIRASAEGYRDVEPPRWRVAPLPEEETALSALDESLSGVAHTVAREGRHARFTLERAVVVAPPSPRPTTTQAADVVVPTGTQLVDGALRLAVVSDAVATRLRDGGSLPPPSNDAVERARAAGYIGELMIPETPSRVLRALMALTMAALATAGAFTPALLAASRFIEPTPWAESTVTAVIGLALSGLGVLLLARVSREPSRA